MIVVVGEVMLDVVAFHDAPLAVASDTPARISLRPGGAGANTAAWLARAGVDVALIARVGDDDAAAAALARLDGVDLRVGVDPHLPTGTCIVLVSPGGERTMLPDPGANIALQADGLPDDLFAAGNDPARLRLLADAARLARRRAGRRWTRRATRGCWSASTPPAPRCCSTIPRSWTARGRSTCCCPTRTSSPRSAATCRA